MASETNDCLLRSTKDYNGANWDTYSLLTEPDGVVASCQQVMDDNAGSSGTTQWSARFPRDMIQQAFFELEKSGSARIALETLVRKIAENNWVYGGEKKEETYLFPVIIEMQKKDRGTDLRIQFQEKMEVYF